MCYEDGVMLLRYNTEKLNKVVVDFHVVTGIPVSILDADCNHLAGYPVKTNKFCKLVQSCHEGLERCGKSDRELLNEAKNKKCAVTRHCHAGLADTVVPIYSHDRLLGFIMFGQIGDGEESKTPFSEIYKNLCDLDIDKKELESAYENFVFPDKEKIESATAIVTIMTKYILLEHMIEPECKDDLNEIINFIDENLSEDLSVTSICRRFLISKNTLYGFFREHFNCSVKEYVNARKIDHAEKLLKTTQYSVSEISELCGINNYQYFCRIFKRAKGETPLQYRKKWENEHTYKRISK